MEISTYLIWNVIITLVLAPLLFSIRKNEAEAKRIDILLNKTREEIAREYVTKQEVKEDMKGKDVEFLYVSIDDDVDAWKKFLADDPAFANAIHIATYSGWKSDITEDYLIEGIPRYLLIDKEGKIISANAPRPSSKEIRPMIEEALKA